MNRKILPMVLSSCLAATGCGHLPEAKTLGKVELEREIATRRSIMLLNFTFISEGAPILGVKPVSSFGTSPDETRIELTRLAPRVMHNTVERVFATSYDDQLKGWSFFTLEPGPYVVKLHTSDGCEFNVGVLVPPGQHVIYLGAYQWAQHVKEKDRYWTCHQITDISAQERDHMRSLAARYFSTLGPPIDAGLAGLSAPSSPVGMVLREQAAIEPYDWVGKGAERGGSKIPPICVGGGSGSPGEIPLLAICALTATASLAATGIGGLSGKLDQTTWRSCEQKVGEVLKKIDLHALARETMSGSLESWGFKPSTDLSSSVDMLLGSQKSGVKSLLEIRFRPFRWFGEGERLFLSTGVDASLWDVSSGSSLKAWSFIAAEAGWPTKQSRSLKDLCQGDATVIVGEEVRHLMTTLMGRIGKDMMSMGKPNAVLVPSAQRTGP